MITITISTKAIPDGFSKIKYKAEKAMDKTKNTNHEMGSTTFRLEKKLRRCACLKFKFVQFIIEGF